MNTNPMKFVFSATESDGGGSLTITAFTPDDKKDLVGIAKWMHLIEEKDTYSVLAGEAPYTVSFHPGDTKRNGFEAWYELEITLDNAWLLPYTKELESRTGYTGPIGDFMIEVAHASYTHCRTNLRVADGCLRATVYDSAHPWNGCTAKQYAHQNMQRYLCEDVGEVRTPREFIETASGLFKRNPAYGKGRSPVVPARHNYLVWNALWKWWLDNHINPKQREILDKAQEHESLNIPLGFMSRHHLPSGDLVVTDPDGKINWDNKGTMVRFITWKEFAALK